MLNACLPVETHLLITQIIAAEKKFADLMLLAADFCALKVVSDEISLLRKQLTNYLFEHLHLVSLLQPVPEHTKEEVQQTEAAKK